MIQAPHVRRLQNLIHSLGTEGALDEVTDGNSAHEGRQTGILALLLGDIVGEDLCGIAERRL